MGYEKTPSSRLFCQYQAPQTKAMKQIIIKEISKKNSRIRVIFATTALGMGVNIPHVENVYHITLPSNLEAYVQEIGRAEVSNLQQLFCFTIILMFRQIK